MKHIGLFEGIGGFSLAARWMGWETIAWCEINPFCQTVLKHHFPNAIPHTDIKETDFTPYANTIDIITGGFPCQPFSMAGKRKGTEDDRHLWPQMLRAIREIKPLWVVGENVYGITNWDGGVVFEQVQADLENEGYEVQAYILPACAVNAPHRRDRVWFVAHSNDNWLRRREQQQKSKQEKSGGNKFNGFCEKNITDPSIERLEGCAGQKLQGDGNGFARRFWQNFPTQPPICGRNDGLSPRLDGITFPKWRKESIKAYGNAIVPQVALQIFKAIEQFDTKAPL